MGLSGALAGHLISRIAVRALIGDVGLYVKVRYSGRRSAREKARRCLHPDHARAVRQARCVPGAVGRAVEG